MGLPRRGVRARPSLACLEMRGLANLQSSSGIGIVYPCSRGVSERVGINVPTNTLSVISVTSLSSQSLALVLTT